MRTGRPPQLTEAAVRAIRRAYQVAKAEGRRPDLKTYADRYGITRGAIWRICVGANYRWVQ
jgi:hypothetical protein